MIKRTKNQKSADVLTLSIFFYKSARKCNFNMSPQRSFSLFSFWRLNQELIQLSHSCEVFRNLENHHFLQVWDWTASLWILCSIFNTLSELEFFMVRRIRKWKKYRHEKMSNKVIWNRVLTLYWRRWTTIREIRSRLPSIVEC